MSMIMRLPTSLTEAIGSAEWEVMRRGESGASVYRLQSDITRYLKITNYDAFVTVEDEVNRLEWLKGRVPVPDILHYCDDDSRQYMLMTNIEGMMPLHQHSDWTHDDKITMLAETARRFHDLPISECPFRRRLEDLIYMADQRIANDEINLDELDEQWDVEHPRELYEQMLSIMPDEEQLVVTHGDLYPVNVRVLVPSGRLSGYIDVGRMAVADLYIDLARITHAITWHLGEEWIEPFFDAYGEPLNWDKLRAYQMLVAFV